MTLIHLLIVLAIVGFILWLINSFIPMPRPIKMLINLLVIVFIALWILSILGIVHHPILHRLRF